MFLEKLKAMDEGDIVYLYNSDGTRCTNEDGFPKVINLKTNEIYILEKNIDKNPDTSDTSKFNHDMTVLLIECYIARKDKIASGRYKMSIIHKEIVAEFLKKGYSNVTADGISRKWRNLKIRYYAIKHNKKKTTRGCSNWPYYALLSAFYDDEEMDEGVASNARSARRKIDWDRKLIKRRREAEPLWVHELLAMQRKQVKELQEIKVALNRANDIQEMRNKLLEKRVEKNNV